MGSLNLSNKQDNRSRIWLSSYLGCLYNPTLNYPAAEEQGLFTFLLSLPDPKP